MPGQILEWFLLMQPTKVKEFIDRALAASSHDLPGVLEGFKWVYEKVWSLHDLANLNCMNWVCYMPNVPGQVRMCS